MSEEVAYVAFVLPILQSFLYITSMLTIITLLCFWTGFMAALAARLGDQPGCWPSLLKVKLTFISLFDPHQIW
jgi:hypothetical protein